MTETAIQMTPSERLAAIVAAGVAAYQSRWAEAVADKTEPAPRKAVENTTTAVGEISTGSVCQASEETAPPRPHIFLTEERQRELCLSCTLPECVDVTHPRCPIRIEQRAEWRRQNRRKMS